MCSDAPDMSGVNAAAAANADIAKEALAWYKQQYADTAPMRDALGQRALEVADQQLASSKANDALAKDYADYQTTTFRPLEQGIVADAENYDTPEKRQQAATAAMADVNSSMAAVRDARTRRLAAEGINPGSTRAMAALDGVDVEQAKASSLAARQARQGVETTGFARKMDAASLGRNLASNQATSAQVALTAGNSSVNNTGVPVQTAAQAASTYGAGFNTAISGNNSAGSLYGQAASTQASANDALWGALGQVGGAAISAWGNSNRASDKTLKTDIADEDPDRALAEITATSIKSWRYDPATLAARGIEVPPEDMGQNTGPMAQDAQATMGDKVAPGGKVLNMGNLVGKVALSVQALDTKVNKLAQMIGAGQLQAGAA